MRIAETSRLIVSWRCTASSRTVESSALRCLPAITPVRAITLRTASKMRFGSFDLRSLLRHSTSTVGWKAVSVSERPQAAFQLMSISNRRIASRSESSSRLCSTITAAITSAGTDGRPRPEGNRSANISSGNSSLRCSASKAATDPLPRRCSQSAAASRNC